MSQFDLSSKVNSERNLGTQPLDAVMQKHGFTNTDLTNTAEVQLRIDFAGEIELAHDVEL